jgi:curli biogenesis system outer membrane secretion channel CsgG
MKKIILLGLLVFSLSGCAVWHSMIPHRDRPDSNAGIAPLPPYSGLKARVAVADFEVKAAKATTEIGAGLREMLITALTNSNRFAAVERPAQSVIVQEQESPAPEANQQASVIPRNKPKTADLFITVAVTEFEPEASGGRAGLGGGGGVGSGALGGLLGSSFNKAHMVLEIRLSDAATSLVIATSRLQGQASDISASFAAGFFGNWGLGVGLSAYANTPMEKAIRVCIIEAVRYLAQTIPANYYKY